MNFESNQYQRDIGGGGEKAMYHHHANGGNEQQQQPEVSSSSGLTGGLPTPISTNIHANEAAMEKYMPPLEIEVLYPGHPHHNAAPTNNNNNNPTDAYNQSDGFSVHSTGPDEMLFTPLISPAVTPLEAFQITGNEPYLQSIDPGFFTPLSSPALEADYTLGDSAAAAVYGRQQVTNSPKGQHKVKRSVGRVSSAAGGGRKRSSIAVNEHVDVAATSDSLPTAQMSTSPESSVGGAATQLAAMRDGGASDDISPNSSSTNTDVSPSSMPPPPAPSHRILKPAPNNEGTADYDMADYQRASFDFVQFQNLSPLGQQATTANNMVPATPMSLMNLRARGDHQDSITNTTPHHHHHHSNSSISSPSLPKATGAERRKTPSRASSRRSSAQASPIIKPQPSPSLKPLLPGGLSPQIIAQLTNKSNYQNILEGAHDQLGLSYPKNLSNEIESRRTSHKFAEQARRSRINNAIAQLGELLPEDKQRNSKANTVELAIDYIRELQSALAKEREHNEANM